MEKAGAFTAMPRPLFYVMESILKGRATCQLVIIEILHLLQDLDTLAVS